MPLFAFFRFYGLTSIESISLKEPLANIPMTKIMGYYVLTGILLGLLYTIVEFAYEKYSSKRLAIGRLWPLEA